MKSNIGSIIERYRNKIKMSRRELSENICSENYLYLVEKGKRTPSAAVTKMLGDKMGIDFFNYYEYLDCEDPIRVSKIMEKFNKYRMENDINSLEEVTLEAMKLPDFENRPWICEIELNKYVIKVLGKGEFLDSIHEIPKIISEMVKNNAHSICIANFYVLLSTCYHMAKDIEKAKKAIICAEELIESKEKVSKYAQAFVTVKICKISVNYLAGELDNVIEEGMKLNKFEIENSFYERLHYTQFFLAFANYQKGLEEIGVNWFIKALCVSLVRPKPKDIHYLTKFETFEDIIKDERIPKDLVDLFKLEYSIT